MVEFWVEYKDILLIGLLETVYMTFSATIFAYLLGVPLGVTTFITQKNGLSPNKAVNSILGTFINATRSVPFIVLIVVLIPFTRMVAGKAIGSTATIVPLVFASAPYVARLVESSLKELDSGLILAAKSMGATNFQIVTKVLLPETKPSLVRGMGIACINILGYTAMAGTVGGGGLGNVAISYGYIRYEHMVLFVTVVVLIVLVQCIEKAFSIAANKTDKTV